MTGRHNEYFVPGEGISREVIQADICRYLGNDALVRPGNHDVCLPNFLIGINQADLTDNKQGRPGFFISAYRNLTSVSHHGSLTADKICPTENLTSR